MPTITPPAIAALPPAPDPNNRATFNTLAYPWSASLATFGPQVSAVGANVKANADDAALSTAAAGASASQSASSAAASAISAANAATSQTNAATSAALSTANATTATAQNSASGASAAASAVSEAAAAAARDLSVAAWGSSMAPAETLPVISKSIHFGPIVKAIIYDTSKDSDGGAWIKRCQDKSWFKEALGFTGTWRNQLASAVAAWSTSGAVAGDGYQNTTDGKYYVLTGTSTQAEIFRGNVRVFPAQPLAVAQNTPLARVVVYDGAQFGVPLWRVFAYAGKTISSIAMAGGKLFVTTTTGVFVEDLLADSIGRAEKYTAATTPAIASAAVNDIAVTVLDNAPVDPATGLPVPTIAVATAGGVSVIKHDGTVVNSASTSPTSGLSISNERLKAVYFGHCTDLGRLASLNSSFPVNALDGVLVGFTTAYSEVARYISSPLNALAEQPTPNAFGTGAGVVVTKVADAAKRSMLAAITNTYNSGWQVGDIRGAYLADTVAETITSVNPQADRSVKNNPLSVVGSLTKTAVAAGAGLVAYSGFSAANYLEQPYNADLDFGTGDFCVMGWGKSQGVNSGTVLWRGQISGGTFGLNAICLGVSTSTGQPRIVLSDNAGATTVTSGAVSVPNDSAYHQFCAVRRSGVIEIWFDGVLQGSTACTYNLSNTSAVLGVGVGVFNSARVDASPGVCLARITATAPSADQIAHIYRTELPLFQAGAQCTIAGTSTAVTALAQDDTTDLLHVGTSWGRTGFKDLLRVDSEATTVGAITSLSANQGAILQGGTSVRFYQPAMRLRDELRRMEEARRALGKIVQPYWFTGNAVLSAYVLPMGVMPKFVYKQGLLMRDGTGNDYLTSFDGFRWTVTFTDVPPSNHNLCIMGAY